VRVGIGASVSRNPGQAARAAAHAALAQLESSCDLALLFATPAYHPHGLLGAARQVLGDVPLAGCSVRALTTNRQPEPGAHTAAVVAWRLEGARVASAVAPPVRGGWRSTGAALARGLGPMPDDARALFVFGGAEGIETASLEAGLAQAWGRPLSVPLLGGGASRGDSRPFLFHDREVLHEGACAVLLSGDLSVACAVEPTSFEIGRWRTVTRADGDWLCELDGRPALDVLTALMGDDEIPTSRRMRLPLALTPDAGAARAASAVLLIHEVDHNRRAARIAAAVGEGTRLRFVLSDRRSVVELPRRLQPRLDADDASALLYFACADSRQALLMEQDRVDEAAALQQLAGGDTPWLAVETAGVLCPAGGQNRLHHHAAAATFVR
jgi:hypothetical protein